MSTGPTTGARRPAPGREDPSRDDRGPVDRAPRGPRPPLASVAAVVLAGMGTPLVALTALDLADLVAAYVSGTHVDGMTALVVSVMTVIAAGIILAVIAVGALMVVVAVRIWRGVRWAWIEGCGAAVAGALLAGVAALSADPEDGPLRARLDAILGVASLVGALIVVGALVIARSWFGRLYLPRNAREAPFWLRGRFR